MSIVKAMIFAIWATALLAVGVAPAFAKTPFTCTGHKQLCEWRAKHLHTSTITSCRARYDACMQTGIWKNRKGEPFKSLRG